MFLSMHIVFNFLTGCYLFFNMYISLKYEWLFSLFWASEIYVIEINIALAEKNLLKNISLEYTGKYLLLSMTLSKWSC